MAQTVAHDPGRDEGVRCLYRNEDCFDDHCCGGGRMHPVRDLLLPRVADFSAGDRILPRVFDLLFCGEVPTIEPGTLLFGTTAGCSARRTASANAATLPRNVAVQGDCSFSRAVCVRCGQENRRPIMHLTIR